MSPFSAGKQTDAFSLFKCGWKLFISPSLKLLSHRRTRGKNTTGLVGAGYTFCFVITYFRVFVKVSIYGTKAPSKPNSFVKSCKFPNWLS